MILERVLENVDVLAVLDSRSPGDQLSGTWGTEIANIAYRAQGATSGSLFCCVRGASFDGRDFAATAVGAGASALLAEAVVDGPGVRDVPQVIVADTRAAMAQAAANFHGHPSHRVAVAGVTGTNGKTSTTHLLASALTAGGRQAEVIGTLTGPRTTPEAPDLQAALAAADGRGVSAVALEVSSHALRLHRVDATWFEVAVFTNLSPEHLDFHVDMDDYFAAKASLFRPERAAAAVVNADDPWGRRLIEAADIPTRPFSLDDARDLEMRPTGITFGWRGQRVRLGPGGRFTVANALAAATAAAEMGVDIEAIARGLSDARPVPGRFEVVDRGQPFTLVVDYAHTPAGLEASLRAARVLATDAGKTGRVIVVFGCGGDRDCTKRPMMGEIASRLADLTVLTNDNPRDEDPMGIIAAIREGFVDHLGLLRVEPNRGAAIAMAVSAARPGDVVLVAGKGHETVQLVAGESRPFDDRVVAADELSRLPVREG